MTHPASLRRNVYEKTDWFGCCRCGNGSIWSRIRSIRDGCAGQCAQRCHCRSCGRRQRGVPQSFRHIDGDERSGFSRGYVSSSLLRQLRVCVPGGVEEYYQGRQKLTGMADVYDAPGSRVVAMINGDFWDTGILVPRGPIHSNGHIINQVFNYSERVPQQALSYFAVTDTGTMTVDFKDSYYYSTILIKNVILILLLYYLLILAYILYIFFHIFNIIF